MRPPVELNRPNDGNLVLTPGRVKRAHRLDLRPSEAYLTSSKTPVPARNVRRFTAVVGPAWAQVPCPALTLDERAPNAPYPGLPAPYPSRLSLSSGVLPYIR